MQPCRDESEARWYSRLPGWLPGPVRSSQRGATTTADTMTVSMSLLDAMGLAVARDQRVARTPRWLCRSTSARVGSSRSAATGPGLRRRAAAAAGFARASGRERVPRNAAADFERRLRRPRARSPGRAVSAGARARRRRHGRRVARRARRRRVAARGRAQAAAPGCGAEAGGALPRASARSSRALEHPHIARLYDAGVTPRGPAVPGDGIRRGVPIDRYCARTRSASRRGWVCSCRSSRGRACARAADRAPRPQAVATSSSTPRAR